MTRLWYLFLAAMLVVWTFVCGVLLAVLLVVSITGTLVGGVGDVGMATLMSSTRRWQQWLQRRAEAL